ncbi:MAG: EF-P beta-lysylation protein EpmB [Gammaproteobacteria bacterium]
MILPAMPEPNSDAIYGNVRQCGAKGQWRQELRTAVRSAEALCALLGLGRNEIDAADEATKFPVLVPHSFIKRMRHSDPTDPLLRQVLARRIERADVPGFTADPLLETHVAASGILRKYARRALVITTAACPVHCRYCFRRHFPYSDQLAARERWSRSLQSLRESPDIEEVILSGGDPLSLSTRRLRELVAGIEAIDSVTTLRIHTRFPIVVPSRVTPSLTQLLGTTRLKTVVVLHCNHANELAGEDVTDALRRLDRCTDLLLNQSVLLRGINDDPRTLAELSAALFRAHVLPYYLHMLDRVAGSAHFDVPEDAARSLIGELRGRLPGYLVPQLVREESGALSKTPVA